MYKRQLIPIAGNWLGGGDTSSPDFGNPRAIALGFGTIVIILIIQRFARGLWANLSVLMGLIAGTAMAAIAGQTRFDQVGVTPWFAFAHPMLFLSLIHI